MVCNIYNYTIRKNFDFLKNLVKYLFDRLITHGNFNGSKQ